jgi:hypothetical protein
VIQEELSAKFDNPVTLTLHRCRESIIRPYEKLLLIVGCGKKL